MKARYRLLLAAGLIVFGAVRLPALEPATGRHTQNVVLVTTDGLRWQELFRGADPELMNAEAGGVEDLDRLEAAYGRGDAQDRREALMPFFWLRGPTPRGMLTPGTRPTRRPGWRRRSPAM
jgi:hypothetical protein